MFITTQLLITALALATTVSSTAVAAYSRGGASGFAGAAYIINNDPSEPENKVFAIPLSSDGHLGPNIKTFGTKGKGLHGIFNPPPTVQDGLFSQGAVVVNAKAKLLATVNSGSDTVVLFRINPEDPTELTMIGKPVPSLGEFPQSVAINDAGTQACVLNGGKVNGVNCYTIHPTQGLVQHPNTLRFLHRNQTTPPVGPPNTLGQIIFWENDTRLVVSVKGNPDAPGFLVQWPIGRDGSLTPNYYKSPVGPGGSIPFSITPIPGTNAIFSADILGGVDIFNFASKDGKSVELTARTSTVTRFPNQMANCWSTYSSRSGSWYITDPVAEILTEVRLDKNLSPKLVKQYPQGHTAGVIDLQVTTVNHNDYLYLLAANVSTIEVFNVNTPGKATVIQNFELTKPAHAAGATFIPINLQGMATYIKN